MSFSFKPLNQNESQRQYAANSFHLSVIKILAAQTPRPDRVVKYLQRQYKERTGQLGIDIADLSLPAIRFPADLVTHRVSRVLHVATVLNNFWKSPLAQAWINQEAQNAMWGPAGRRAIAVSAAGWGKFVVHDMEHLPPRGAALVIAPTDKTPGIWIEMLDQWARALDWVPPICIDPY